MFKLEEHKENVEKHEIKKVDLHIVVSSIKHLWLTIINNSKQNIFCDMAAELISVQSWSSHVVSLIFSRDI
jgi:hypothetical protein